ncbi:MAG TPA: hypothetical protein PKN23_07615, partial [Candidatus Hydrogenedentes bacterium]|nr:hypothetical protein [Candidatus Hydrogenedentota bacterium]
MRGESASGLGRRGGFGYTFRDHKRPFAHFHRRTADMQINPEIFREYDIRGIAGKDLDESSMET